MDNKDLLPDSTYKQDELRAFIQGVYNELVDTPEEECNLSYVVTATQLPSGAIEIATNTEFLVSKLNYILQAYDLDMKLKTNPQIQMLDVMIV